MHHSIPDLAGWNKETEEKNTLPSESNLLLGTKQNKEATRLIIDPNKSLIKERQSPDLMSYMSLERNLVVSESKSYKPFLVKLLMRSTLHSWLPLPFC